MKHLVVTRFSVPRDAPATAGRHADRRWLDGRLELFRRYFVPSVGRLGVPVVLLCSSASADYVSAATGDLGWAQVVVQDDWYGGWSGGLEETVTRLDSDDALHERWFEALDQAPDGYETYCTKRFLRLDARTGGLYERSRREPAPLAAFRGGRNPYAHDHATLERHYRVCVLTDAYLLQVVHGGNVSSRRPRWWHAPYRVSRDRLAAFGIDPRAAP